MNIPFFDLTRQTETLKNQLHGAINGVWSKGDFVLGRQVASFEKLFADYIGVEACISCGNATDALEMALEVLGIGEGDEVILPAFGWVSGVHAVKRCGAKPLFVDVLLDGTIDPEEVRRVITQKTRAIIPTHLYGIPCPMDVLLDLAREYDCYIIEDCAQAHGAKINDKRVGSIGHLAVFSFYPTKNLGAMGDGGAICTNDTAMAERLKSLRNYAKPELTLKVGRNSRLDEMQAAILKLKLTYLDNWNHRRAQIAESYGLCLGQRVPNGVFHQYVLRVKDRDVFREKLREVGIETGVHYDFCFPVPYRENSKASQLANQVVSLPIFPELTEKEKSYICDHLIRLQDYIL